MRPFFLNGPSGKLFVVLHSAEPLATNRAWVLLVPPFAEELNRCRPMIARQARLLASLGYNVCVADLFGTGDSEGEFGQANWGLWKRDVCFLWQWILSQGAESIVLWGIRSGCLLAAGVLDELDQQSDLAVEQVVFWQPVTSGEAFLKQFLRIKVAAAMMNDDKLSVSDVLSRARQGESIEVAGYELAPALIEQISSVSIECMMFPKGINVHWLEVSASGEQALSSSAVRLVDKLDQQGVCVNAVTVPGEPFWSTQEVAFAPELLTTTAGILGHSYLDRAPVACAASLEDLGECVPGEEAFVFHCEGKELVGVLHRVPVVLTDGITTAGDKGVLLITGGPQYRIGSHRQFVLLARCLAREGVPVFRFDYRGMGDGNGELAGFEHIQPDIAAAMNCFQESLPELKNVVLWGLCDAATAASFYGHSDSRVKGLILLNPWAYSEEGEARAFLRHYYFQRLFNKALWKKVLQGEFRVAESISSLGEYYLKALGAKRGKLEPSNNVSPGLGERIFDGLNRFRGQVLIVLSGKDLTAAQFKDIVSESSGFQRLFEQDSFAVCDVVDADHTFSSAAERQRVEAETLKWLRSW